MSARLLGLALDAQAPSPSAKLVLIKLVDCCNDDGTRIFPSVAAIARAAQCSARTVQRTLRQFCAIGLLRLVKPGGQGPGTASYYEMDVAALARFVKEGWPECSGLNDAADDDAVSPGDGYANDASVDMEPCAKKGDTMSPFDPGRVTPATDKGDTMVSPNPLREPSILRERARASAGSPTSNLEPVTSEGAGEQSRPSGAAPNADSDAPQDTPTLAEFIAAWPSAKVDDRQKIGTAWALLPFAERRAALDGITPYLDERKRVGRKTVPAGDTYLRDRPWHEVGTKPRGPAPGALRGMKAWSREWWALLIARLQRGERVAPMLHNAEHGTGHWTAREADMPPAHAIESFKSFPSDGEAVAAWRPWLEARGARLPAWRDTRFWVWLPSEAPPDEAGRAMSARALAEDDYQAMKGSM